MDIETSSLYADIGSIVVVGILSEKEEKFFFVDNPAKEKEVLSDVVEYFEKLKGEKIYIWNANFDIPFLITRCIKHGLTTKVFTKLKIIDLLKFSKEMLKLSSNRLDDVSVFFGLSKNLKVRGKNIQELYEEYLAGNDKMKDKIIEHCKDDLLRTKEIFQKAKDLIEFWEKKKNL